MATRKRTSSKKAESRFNWMFLIALALIIWSVDFYRNTFIPMYIPLLVFAAGGSGLYMLLRLRLHALKTSNYPDYLKFLAGMVLCGGPLVCLFLALNFCIRPNSQPRTYRMQVIATGHLSSGKYGGCASPYVVVSHEGLEKQLVLPCHSTVINSRYAHVELQLGLFGFPVTDHVQLTQGPATDQITVDEEQRAYDKILKYARQALDRHQFDRAIELYQRAVSFRSHDTIAQQQLVKARWLSHHFGIQEEISGLHAPEWLQGQWGNLLESNLSRHVSLVVHPDKLHLYFGGLDNRSRKRPHLSNGIATSEITSDTLYRMTLRQGTACTVYTFQKRQQPGTSGKAIDFNIRYSLHAQRSVMVGGALLIENDIL